MGPISAFFTADYSPAVNPEAQKSSAVRSTVTALSTMITNARKAAAGRHLRAELAEMDDSLLKDIGVAEDEIYLIRAGQVFTPRAWGPRSRN
jgi:uncharacterized protein YjiS (DUF1127 family)